MAGPGILSACINPGSAMAIVAVYKFRAMFSSIGALPDDGESREGLLLLRQAADARADAAAVAACAFHGAREAVIERYSLLDAAALHRPRNRDFVQLHATALSEGSALVSYVIAAPDAQGSPSQ